MEGAEIALYDPQVSESNIKQELVYAGVPQEIIEKQLAITSSCEEAAKEAHGVAVLTEWDEFKEADFDSILTHMFKPAFIFDGRNALDHDLLKSKGFEVYSIGKG